MKASPSMLARTSVWVVLSAEQVDQAVSLGNCRCQAKPDDIRPHDSGYHEDDDRSFPHRLGALGEMAYAKYTGRSIDRSFSANGDDMDFVGVEVKTSTFGGNGVELKVKVREWNRKQPLLYVLARVDPESLEVVELVGEINRNDFDEHKKLVNYGHQDNYVIQKCFLSTVRSATGKTRLAPVVENEQPL